MGRRESRVFIGPVEISGFYRNLATGLKGLGLNVDLVILHPHPFKYSSIDNGGLIARIIIRINTALAGKRRSVLWPNLFLKVIRDLFSIVFLIRCLFVYDVFVFGFGKSIMRGNLDLPILRLFGKVIIANVWHGSEGRPAYLNGVLVSPDGLSGPSVADLRKKVKAQKMRLGLIEQFAQVVISAPFTSHFLSRPSVNFFAIGMPIVEQKDNETKDNEALCPAGFFELHRTKIRILHCPSHPYVKGTAQIREAVQNLRETGYSIEYLELIGRPNKQVQEELSKCDLVVDQIYSDTPMATFAAEAASHRKAAIVGGYNLDQLREFIPSEMYPDSFVCRPDEIQDAIEDLLLNPAKRVEIATQARDFVADRWGMRPVAERYARLIKGDINPEWMFDPLSVIYCAGCGQPIERTRNNIKSLLKEFGTQALGLSHNRALECAMVEFAREHKE